MKNQTDKLKKDSLNTEIDPKKKLNHLEEFFGVLSDEEADQMLKDIYEFRRPEYMSPTQRHAFTQQEYLALANILQNQRTELIEGDINEMAPIGTQHAACVSLINHLLAKTLDDTIIIRIQDPIQLNNYSLPQPDICLAQFKNDFYQQQHPTPDDIVLIIEVADSSLQYDLNTKIPLYAQHQIAETWLIDLPNKQLAAYYQPTAQGYCVTQHYTAPAVITAQHLPTCALNLATVF
jgi:hypothetical protein